MSVDWEKLERLADAARIELDVDRLQYIENNWNEFTEIEYETLLQKLYEAVPDPITHGRGYGQKDIIKHLKKLS